MRGTLKLTKQTFGHGRSNRDHHRQQEQNHN
ncbi:Uncharacterised protein [Vibrio cholerae]|nr:Uncharacterised protein [Vibrio cholerae]